jgi:hypothetical protein
MSRVYDEQFKAVVRPLHKVANLVRTDLNVDGIITLKVGTSADTYPDAYNIHIAVAKERYSTLPGGKRSPFEG